MKIIAKDLEKLKILATNEKYSVNQRGAMFSIIFSDKETFTVETCRVLFNSGSHKTSKLLNELISIGFLTRSRKVNYFVTEINEENFNNVKMSAIL